MQAVLQTALFHAFDTLNLQHLKSFNVPPVTLHGVGALAACGPSRGYIIKDEHTNTSAQDTQ
ncbi:hypothetical protein Q6284_33955, partial [Klebsiella pneumoniae]|nr:hypothetical protein [Klebsiella pneumoniae]